MKIKKENLSFKRFSTFEALPPNYEVFWEECAGEQLFGSLDWFKTLVELTSVDGGYLIIYAIESLTDDGRHYPLVILPAFEKSIGFLSVKKRALYSLANYYTSLYSPIHSNVDNSSLILECCLKGIAGERPRWDVITIDPLADDATLSYLKHSLESNGFGVFPYFRFWNWYLLLEGRNFDEYIKSVPKRVINTIQRKQRKLDRELGFEIRIFKDKQDLVEAKAAYWQVYRNSWKQAEPFESFIDSLIDLAASNGGLRLGVVYTEKVPIAVQLWIVLGETASIYKLAYDEKYANYSPGSILTMKMFEYVIDVDKVPEIDYLTGNDNYKKDWMSHRRPRLGLVGYNKKTFLGRFLYYKEKLWRFIKAYRKSV